MRVLHVVKTADGAAWAAKLVTKLCALGVNVHVAMPRLDGRAQDFWKQSGATLHACDLELSVRRPLLIPDVLRRTRQLISVVSPDIIHSHFVGTTLALRLALGKDHSIPRIFQVPGPLHLEHPFFRSLELSQAGASDYWIGSSRCIVDHYWRAGVSRDRVFLSYYGDDLTTSDGLSSVRSLRARVGARTGDILVGNVSWMYPPKYYLGQRIGLKAHEDVIQALGLVCRADPRVRGVLAGSAWGGADWYERRLKHRARQAAGDRIVFTGALPFVEAKQAWHDLDLAVHVPISENCGGVIEPLLASVPVIASRVGGLPEVIFDDLTGTLVPVRDPAQLAEAILHDIHHLDLARRMALRGQRLVRMMFDVNRTAREVHAVYSHILSGAPRPPDFDSRATVKDLADFHHVDSGRDALNGEPSAEKECEICQH